MYVHTAQCPFLLLLMKYAEGDAARLHSPNFIIIISICNWCFTSLNVLLMPLIVLFSFVVNAMFINPQTVGVKGISERCTWCLLSEKKLQGCYTWIPPTSLLGDCNCYYTCDPCSQGLTVDEKVHTCAAHWHWGARSREVVCTVRLAIGFKQMLFIFATCYWF